MKVCRTVSSRGPRRNETEKQKYSDFWRRQRNRQGHCDALSGSRRQYRDCGKNGGKVTLNKSKATLYVCWAEPINDEGEDDFWFWSDRVEEGTVVICSKEEAEQALKGGVQE